MLFICNIGQLARQREFFGQYYHSSGVMFLVTFYLCPNIVLLLFSAGQVQCVFRDFLFFAENSHQLWPQTTLQSSGVTPNSKGEF